MLQAGNPDRKIAIVCLLICLAAAIGAAIPSIAGIDMMQIRGKAGAPEHDHPRASADGATDSGATSCGTILYRTSHLVLLSLSIVRYN